MTGKVYLVGAGPGAPDLVTLRAAELLRAADIVFYDALVHPETVALARAAEKVAVGKRCGRHSTAQRFINKRLLDAVQKHAVVVRLKGGDPMLFGRAQEEIAALQAAGIEVVIVPGVSSAFAASASLGVSLTRRGTARSVLFVTPRVGDGEDGHDWAKTIAGADTVVIYMGAGQAALIAKNLIAAGVSDAIPVAVVENASLPGERRFMMTLRELPLIGGAGLTGPALIMLGNVFADAVSSAVDALPRAVSA
jgi:uroporphyrin-III C-methyltransferase